MRHFRSERNVVFITVENGTSLLYFPDNNETTWRWSKAFVQVLDWQIPPQDSCWWCGSGEGFSGYLCWSDQAGRVWKVGGHGDPFLDSSGMPDLSSATTQ